MESRADIIKRHTSESYALQERHKRELDELESRWWQELFTENPFLTFDRHTNGYAHWVIHELPTIIRKREKIGVTVYRDRHWPDYIQVKWIDKNGIPHNLHGPSVEELLEHITDRTLAPGEKVDI